MDRFCDGPFRRIHPSQKSLNSICTRFVHLLSRRKSITLKIVFLTSAFENVAGYWRAFYLGKYLAKQGHTVQVFAQANSMRATTKIIDGVHIYLLPSFSKKPENKTAATAGSVLFQTGFNALSSIIMKSDVLHVFDALFPQNALPVLLSKIKPRNHRPLVIVDWDDLWGQGGILQTFHENLIPPIKAFLTFMEEKIPTYGDAVTVTCEALKRRAIAAGVEPERILMLPNGTDLETVGYVDVLTARKLVGLPASATIYTCSKSSFDPIRPNDDPLWDVLVAHNIVAKTFPDAYLLFMGKGSERCLAAAKNFGMERNIISVGWQPREKYFLYLASSDFFLLPLAAFNASFDETRCPLRLMDYMATGRPIIATALPEVQRIASGCSLLVNPGDRDDLVDKILQFLQNPRLREEMGRIAKDRVAKDYSWSTLAKRLERAYYDYHQLPRHIRKSIP